MGNNQKVRFKDILKGEMFIPQYTTTIYVKVDCFSARLLDGKRTFRFPADLTVSSLRDCVGPVEVDPQ